MLHNIVLASLASALAVILGFLAYHTTLHPPQTSRQRILLKSIFAFLSLGTIAMSIGQAYWNYVDQQSSDAKFAAYSKAVNSGFIGIREFFATKCLSEDAFQRLTERCVSQVLAAVVNFRRPQPEVMANLKQPAAPVNVEHPATSPEIHAEGFNAMQKPNLPPSKEALPAETRPSEYLESGVVIRYSDGPRCVDAYSLLVYQGCEDSSCETACVTLPLEDAPKISAPNQKPK